jgi:hypothetical protein
MFFDRNSEKYKGKIRTQYRMEVAAFLLLAGAGYVATTYMDKKPPQQEKVKMNVETFVGGALRGSKQEYSNRVALVTPMTTPTGELDIQYALPTGGSIVMEPHPSSMKGLRTNYATQNDVSLGSMAFPDSASPAPQEAISSVSPMVLQRGDMDEVTPNYSRGQRIVSPLSGVEQDAGDFTHNNMVPFYRGSVKQNMADSGNTNILDTYTGAASTQFNKQEQGPMFDLQREPTGNPNGIESHSDFMQSRMVGPTNRANEKPFEPVHVGPGLAQGYTSVPSGGYQQADSLDFARPRSTDEIRTTNNPKITYASAVLPGKSVVGNRGQLGDVRKYLPDRYYINQNGERNFVNGGVDKKERIRSMEILKHQARTETTQEHFGTAGYVDQKGEYTIPSFRAPHVSQHGEFGWRNADATNYFNKNTDSEQNDYGKSGIEIRPNERYFTGDRVEGLNLAPDARETSTRFQDSARPTRNQETLGNIRGAGNFTAIGAGLPGAMTVYDPNDIARTTIKETTVDNDWVGMAAPADGPTKLTVYDPEDIARVTGRNTLAEPDKTMNISLQGVPNKPLLKAPDGMRYTQKASISAKSDYTGTASSQEGGRSRVYDAEYKMRQDAGKEQVAVGRKPIAGNGNLPIFSGEDNMNIGPYKKLDSDYINDRQPPVYRVNGPPAGAEVIGLQKYRAPLRLDMSTDRFNPASVKSLQENPYTIDLSRRAAGID